MRGSYESGRSHDRYFYKDTQDGSLHDLLDQCGHYFAHRIGASRRGQESVLIFLKEHPDVTQKQLCEGLGITPASLSEVLMKLERKGLIERWKDETDRRLLRARLTKDGEKELEEASLTSDDPFRALSAEEQDTLTGLLEKLLNDWHLRYMTERGRTAGRDAARREHSSGRDFERHGNEHPGHGNDHGREYGLREGGREDGRRHENHE